MYDDGAEYMVRVNDDTEFITSGWIDMGINALQNFNPPNVGVVGPTFDMGKLSILTHDMVHRTHLDIFDTYYPDVFSAWYIDDWITQVYEPGRMKKLTRWIVKHHVHKHGTRYKIQRQEKSHLAGQVSAGRKKLQTWLHEHGAR